MATRLPTKRGHGGDAGQQMTAMEPEESKPVSTTAREKGVLAAYWQHVGGKPANLSKERCVNVFGNCFRVTCYTHKPDDYERPTHCAWIVIDDEGKIKKIDLGREIKVSDGKRRGGKW